MNKHLDTACAMATVSIRYQQWLDNLTFEESMETVSRVLQRLPATGLTLHRFEALSPPLPKVSVGDNGRHCTSDKIFSLIHGWSETDEAGTLLAPLEPELSVISQPLLTFGFKTGRSPRISPIFWLGQLKNVRYSLLPGSWQAVMIKYGLAKMLMTLYHRVYHMPFSRDLSLSERDARGIREMCQECMVYRGILLIQPKHIISFKLMGIKCLLTNKPGLARSLLDTARYCSPRTTGYISNPFWSRH